MTEHEWRTGDNDRGMMFRLTGRASLRKLRLLTCACLRRVRFYDQNVTDLIEGYADGKVRRRDAMSAVKAAVPRGRTEAYCALLFWKKQCHYGADIACAFSLGHAAESRGAPDLSEERRCHADLIRCVFGNPYRPVRFAPSWRTADVMALARAVYDEGTFDRLPIVADALEDAGCADRAVLEHCRGPGPHARGCWVVDLILGKD